MRLVKVFPNYKESTSGSGTFAHTSTSFAPVTNLSVTFTPMSKRVRLTLIPGALTGYVRFTTPAFSTDCSGYIVCFMRDGNRINYRRYYTGWYGYGSPTYEDYQSPSLFWHIDSTEPGTTYTYTIETRLIGTTSGTVRFNDCKLAAMDW